MSARDEHRNRTPATPPVTYGAALTASGPARVTPVRPGETKTGAAQRSRTSTMRNTLNGSVIRPAAAPRYARGGALPAGGYRALEPQDFPVLVESSEAAQEAPDAPPRQRWEGILGIEGEMTGDGRFIENGAIEWDISPDNPAPLRVVTSDVGAHDGAMIAGRIQQVERRAHPDPEQPDVRIIWGAGDFDMGGDSGQEAYRLVSEDLMTGVSMDLDNVVFEVRAATVDGTPIAQDSPEEVENALADASTMEVTATTKARLRAATIVQVPAFHSAKIKMASDDPDDPDAEDSEAEEELPSDPARVDEYQRNSTSPAAREAAAERGEAMKDGSWPIRNKADWQRATQAIGRAKDRAKVERWIRKRARELDIPKDEWPGWLATRPTRDPRPAARARPSRRRTAHSRSPRTRRPARRAVQLAEEDAEGAQDASETGTPAETPAGADSGAQEAVEGRDGLDALEEATNLMIQAAEVGFPSQEYVDLAEAALPLYDEAVVSGDLGDDDLLEQVQTELTALEEFLETDWTSVILEAEETGTVEGLFPDEDEAADLPDDDTAAVTASADAPAATYAGPKSAKQKARENVRVPKGQKNGGQFKPLPTSKLPKKESLAQRKQRMIAQALENAQRIIEAMLVNAKGKMGVSLQQAAEAIEDAAIEGAKKAATKQERNEGKNMPKGGGGDPTDPSKKSTGTGTSKDSKDGKGKSTKAPTYAQRINKAKKAIDTLLTQHGSEIPKAKRKKLKSISKRVGKLAGADVEAFTATPTSAPTLASTSAQVETFNWVDDVGGLPRYIRKVADALQRKGMTESRAIATAVNTIKRWARGGKDAKVDTIAKAVVALAEWEMKKALAKVTAAQTTVLAQVNADSAMWKSKAKKTEEPAPPKTARPDSDALKLVKDALVTLREMAEDPERTAAERKTAEQAIKDVEKSLKKIKGTHSAAGTVMRVKRSSVFRARSHAHPAHPAHPAPRLGQWRAPRGAAALDGATISGLWVDLPDKIVEDLLRNLSRHHSRLGPVQPDLTQSTRATTARPLPTDASNEEFYRTLETVTNLVTPATDPDPLDVARSGEVAVEAAAHVRHLRDLLPRLTLVRFEPFDGARGPADAESVDVDEFLAYADVVLSQAIHDLDTVGNINWWNAPTVPDAGDQWYGDDPTEYDDDEIEWDDDSDRRVREWDYAALGAPAHLTASSAERRERRRRTSERRRQRRQVREQKHQPSEQRSK